MRSSLFSDPATSSWKDKFCGWFYQKTKCHSPKQPPAMQVPMTVIYDGGCGFCKLWVSRLKRMDFFGKLRFLPMQEQLSEMKLVVGEKTYGGFQAFRRLTLALPMLYPLILLVYFPGASFIGNIIYRFIAKNRHCLIKKS